MQHLVTMDLVDPGPLLAPQHPLQGFEDRHAQDRQFTRQLEQSLQQ